MDERDLAVLEELDIDLDVEACAQVLEAHGVYPDADLLAALWQWKEGPLWPSEEAQR